MFYKQWAIDKSWLPKSGLQILIQRDRQSHPDTIPGLVQPSFDLTNLDKLAVTLKKISAYLKGGAKACWQEWMTNTREGDRQQPQLPGQEGL